MALSGSFDYLVTAANVITAAAEDIQVVQNGETMDNADLSTALVTLNLMTKEWMGKPGFAPGLKKWSRKLLYVFLRKNKSVYTLCSIASSGDYAAVGSYKQGTLTASAASGTTLAVSAMVSAPDYQTAATPANTDYIGVQLDSGDFQWNTVSGSPTLPGNVTIGTALTGPVSSGARVFSFPVLSQCDVPLDILTAVRRDINAIDYPSDKMFDVYEYEQIANKNITSTFTRWLYVKERIQGKLYLDVFPTTLTDVLRAWTLYPLDDLDLSTNDVCFPQQWYSALEWGLAKKLAPKFGKAWTQTHQENLDESMASASATDPDSTQSYFQPGRD